MNIAIVDDEPVFLKQLHNRLREMKLPDCEIHEFTSGRDLLSFYVKGMYEVIILDVEMPDLNGLQTAERIRQIDNSVIISFLTNYAEFAVQGYDVGAFRYILKNQPELSIIENSATGRDDVVQIKYIVKNNTEYENRVHTMSWDNYDISNDYSLNGGDYSENDRILVYYNGVLVSGNAE